MFPTFWVLCYFYNSQYKILAISKTYCSLVNQGTFQGTYLHFPLFLIRLIKKKKIALHTAVTLKQYLQ